MDITIKIDLTENTIKALHEVAAAITQPKGVRVSLTELADAASHLQKGPVSDWVPQDTRYTDTPAKTEEPQPVEPEKEAPKQEEPTKKPATKKAAPKKTEETKPAEPAKQEAPAEPKKEAAKAPTKDDVTKVLTQLMEAKGGDKSEAMALVKKNSTNGKLSGVAPEKYADIIAEAEAAING